MFYEGLTEVILTLRSAEIPISALFQILLFEIMINHLPPGFLTALKLPLDRLNGYEASQQAR